MKSLVIALALLVSAVNASAAVQKGTFENEYVNEHPVYTLKVVGPTAAQLTINANRCYFNELGEVEACTMMGLIYKNVKLVPKAVAANRLTSVYSLEGENLEIVTNLRRPSVVRLIERDEQDRVINALTLRKK